MNSCEVNHEEDGDDSSFQMTLYENSTNSEDAEGFGLYRTGTDSKTVKPYVVSVQLGKCYSQYGGRYWYISFNCVTVYIQYVN